MGDNDLVFQPNAKEFALSEMLDHRGANKAQVRGYCADVDPDLHQNG